MLEHVYLAGGLVVGLQDILVGLVNLLVDLSLHDTLECLDSVSFHSLELLALKMVLCCDELSLTFDLIDLGHDFPRECVSELCLQAFKPNLV